MVDGITAAYGGNVPYSAQSPYPLPSGQATGTQTASISIETEQETIAAQVTQGGSVETLYYSSYSQSVTISVGSGVGGSGSNGSGSAGASGGTPTSALEAQT